MTTTTRCFPVVVDTDNKCDSPSSLARGSLNASVGALRLATLELALRCTAPPAAAVPCCSFLVFAMLHLGRHNNQPTMGGRRGGGRERTLDPTNRTGQNVMQKLIRKIFRATIVKLPLEENGSIYSSQPGESKPSARRRDFLPGTHMWQSQSLAAVPSLALTQ